MGKKKEEEREGEWGKRGGEIAGPWLHLLDDALLRSRLQAHNDGTSVMDSKWLKIVVPCHRDTLSIPLLVLHKMGSDMLLLNVI